MQMTMQMSTRGVAGKRKGSASTFRTHPNFAEKTKKIIEPFKRQDHHGSKRNFLLIRILLESSALKIRGSASTGIFSGVIYSWCSGGPCQLQSLLGGGLFVPCRMPNSPKCLMFTLLFALKIIFLFSLLSIYHIIGIFNLLCVDYCWKTVHGDIEKKAQFLQNITFPVLVENACLRILRDPSACILWSMGGGGGRGRNLIKKEDSIKSKK